MTISFHILSNSLIILSFNTLQSEPLTVMRFQVFMVASMKMTAFWDIALCNLEGAGQCVRGLHCVHHHDNDGCSQYIPLKCQSTFMRLHSVTSQKTVLFILTVLLNKLQRKKLTPICLYVILNSAQGHYIHKIWKEADVLHWPQHVKEVLLNRAKYE
jgi:hypothetical protein